MAKDLPIVEPGNGQKVRGGTGTAGVGAGGPLLDSKFMARLGQLDVLSRKMLAGKLKGERRSKRRGQSVEFADYRNYVIGDDLRFLDWNLFARLEKLFIRLFAENNLKFHHQRTWQTNRDRVF